ncbi:MAG: response regulator transcription factor [Lachnospiraceae bacterium]|nr:response regulator transcription factor [Lachnospiraceae bacterium]
MKILIVEEEKTLAESIHTMLKPQGFHIEIIRDGASGPDYAALGIYDLIILEMALQSLRGCEVVRRIRAQRCGTPILMLTCAPSPKERVEALNGGADYYLARPFEAEELLACIHALVRRQGAQVDTLTWGNTSLELSSGTLICGVERVRLSSREFDVMRLLMQNPRYNLSKETILAHVWGYDSNAIDNHVEVYVSILRKKLALIHSNIKIVASRRLGYHLDLVEK